MALRFGVLDQSPVLCVFVICARSSAEAERLATSINLRRVHMARGIDAPVPTLEEARAHRCSEPERTYVEQQRARGSARWH